ncbi:hypothetical protein [uncultured Bartonella sp.]|nr:hypothetical protein [uncultured Bartonella sp.]
MSGTSLFSPQHEVPEKIAQKAYFTREVRQEGPQYLETGIMEPDLQL